ncbi:MAG: Adenylate kinase [Candidatus Collierbacteria bacterium GW2011_GWC1_45_47]|uniref:Adenylate kinase n=2 Tax=Candidatus Collieribacteriota TaxID=1752725 RepID=A0A0G1SB88_9BACT|nr:MAG: Adenylate kinase [Candidatus Collierbacteria bacterium GW2011_GWB1_44_35]KKU09716.1 MAG: Adenylate kinase [Candidatus Collierbacteria bacterium GW2011_GWC1_45_47]KKU30560.1 MAG: Adenylate kinase [Candidatus Collierbacteria bacterium GW2011_GWE1_46_18]
MNLIILGPQGSGKGTQAKLLADKYNLNHISTGELIRQEVASNSPFGRVLQEKINTGELISDSELFSVLEKTPLNQKNGFILDGTPRNLFQAQELEKVFKRVGVKLDKVVLLTLSHEESLNRMRKRAEIEHRTDDNDEAMQKRLELYQNETVPVIDFYRQQGKVIEVNGTPDIDTVFRDIVSKLEDVKYVS